MACLAPNSTQGPHVIRMAACFVCTLAVAASWLAMAQPSGTVDLKDVEGGHFKLDKSHARIVFSTTHLGFSS